MTQNSILNDEQIMKFKEPFIQAKFLKRPNRFLAKVLLPSSNTIVEAHVPDPGRLKEILLKDALAVLQKSANPSRKTLYTLVGVKKKDIWVNIDSHISNRLFLEEFRKISVFKNFRIIKPEFPFGKSRYDFLMKNITDKDNPRSALIEIKSVTLEEDGLALFPDAPTTRGTKHVLELIEGLKKGYESYIVFIIKMNNVHSFSPNYSMDPKFTSALRYAYQSGVKIVAVKCFYDPIVRKELKITAEVPIIGLK